MLFKFLNNKESWAYVQREKQISYFYIKFL